VTEKITNTDELFNKLGNVPDDITLLHPTFSCRHYLRHKTRVFDIKRVIHLLHVSASLTFYSDITRVIYTSGSQTHSTTTNNLISHAPCYKDNTRTCSASYSNNQIRLAIWGIHDPAEISRDPNLVREPGFGKP
jgi:hypothetical protein